MTTDAQVIKFINAEKGTSKIASAITFFLKLVISCRCHGRKLVEMVIFLLNFRFTSFKSKQLDQE